jgi:uncharacterized tellurite resistance protein B-like protein
MNRSKDLGKLSPAERRKLLRFVIAFAWSDLAITPAELAYIERLMQRLHLSPEESADVTQWMKTPPQPEEVDPTTIPREHRQIFIEAVRELMHSDGRASDEEKENFRLLERLTL